MPDLSPVEMASLNVEISTALKTAIVTIARHNRRNISDQVREILYAYVRSMSSEAYRNVLRSELGEGELCEVRESILDVYRQQLASPPTDLPW